MLITTLAFKESLGSDFFHIKSMRSLDWLLDHLNKARKQNLVYNGEFHMSDLLHINNYSYKSFYIKKKRGGNRSISQPSPKLRILQECLMIVLEEVYTPNPSCFGFIKGKSIYDNATIHSNSDIVCGFDLEDFFDSITEHRIIKVLSSKHYNLESSVATTIAKLCTVPKGSVRVLPQGSPTSPILSNIIADQLDYRLTKLCSKFEITYSRYADDLTFSFNYSCLKRWKSHGFRKGLKEIIESIVREEGFTLNERKTHISYHYQRQTVTGIIVNRHPNLTREFVKTLRTLIHNWEKDGYISASFKYNSFINTQNHSRTVKSLDYHIAGKLAYMKMIKGKDDTTYLSLLLRYNNVRSRDMHLLSLINLDLANKKIENIFVKREHYIFKEDLTDYRDRSWRVIKRRKLNKSEKDLINSNLIIPGDYGNIVEFELKDGTTCFIPLSEHSIYGVGDSINPNEIEILLLGFNNKRAIYRIAP